MHLISTELLVDSQDLPDLTHWSRDEMAAILQTMFSNAFSSMKIYEFRLKCNWSLFLGVQLTIFQHWFKWWIGAAHATSHHLNQCWPSLLMHICVSRPPWIHADMCFDINNYQLQKHFIYIQRLNIRRIGTTCNLFIGNKCATNNSRWESTVSLTWTNWISVLHVVLHPNLLWEGRNAKETSMPVVPYRYVGRLTNIGNPIVEIRLLWDLIFTMIVPMLARRHFHIESGP